MMYGQGVGGVLEGLIVLCIFLFIVALMLGFYFLPTTIAVAMHNPNVIAIFLLNFFTGFTGVGWLGALIWAVIV